MEIFIKFREILKEIRIASWYKGLYVIAAVLWVTHDFSKSLSLVIIGALVFVFTSSIVYIINDIKDIKYDKLHPIKKNRPLAKGTLTLVEAYSIALLLGGVVLIILGVLHNTVFSLLILLYFIANLFYTNWLKHVALIDILMVSSFAVLRVVSGFVILGLPIAWYFAALMFSITMFVLIMQRLAELEISKDFSNSTRPALRWYSPSMLHFFMTLLLMSSSILYFITTAIVLPELIYTDVFYIALMFLSYEKFAITNKAEYGKRVNVFEYLMGNRNFVAISTLFFLVLITVLVWFKW